MPLLLQIVMCPLNLYESEIFQIHFLSREATGKLARPWKVANPFEALTGGVVVNGHTSGHACHANPLYLGSACHFNPLYLGSACQFNPLYSERACHFNPLYLGSACHVNPLSLSSACHVNPLYLGSACHVNPLYFGVTK